MNQGKLFLPWEEIEWIAVRQIHQSMYLCIRLKDTFRWWALYGNDKSHTIQEERTTHAHFTLPQMTLRMPVRQILRRIEQNYAEEVAHSQVLLFSGDPSEAEVLMG